MAENGDAKQERLRSPHTWAMVAGVVLIINGVIQLTGGNMPLGIGSLVLGAAAFVVGYLKLGKKS